MMFVAPVKWSAMSLLALLLLLTACGKTPESEAVADQFIRAYFVENNIAGAAKLASGTARTTLEGVLRQLEAAGAKEPAKDKPRVTVALLEAKSDSADATIYVYRVDSDPPGTAPVTAKLRVSKEGNTWYVSEFKQSE